MVKLVRHIPRDEGLAEILRQQSRSTRDVQRASGTEKARTMERAEDAWDQSEFAKDLAEQLEVELGEANIELTQALADSAAALAEAGLARGEAATAVSDALAAVAEAEQAILDAAAASAAASVADGKASAAQSVAQSAQDDADAAVIAAAAASGAAAAAGDDATDALADAETARLAAVAAQAKADQAFIDAADAATAAGNAQTSADGKNRVWYQGTAPAGTGHKPGDTWFDTSNGNRVTQWDGDSWEATQFGTGAIATAAITNALIADATIQSAKIANLDAAKITTGTLDAARIAALSISTGHLAANAVTAAKIAALTITAAEIASNAVTAIKIAANAVTAEKINAGAVTTVKLDALAVTAEKIAAGAIIADKIAANAITTAKLAADAIDGMTITGALIRTAASGQRMQFDVDGLKSFSSLGVLTSVLSAFNGRFLLSSIADSSGLELTPEAIWLKNGSNIHGVLGKFGLQVYPTPGLSAQYVSDRAFVRKEVTHPISGAAEIHMQMGSTSDDGGDLSASIVTDSPSVRNASASITAYFNASGVPYSRASADIGLFSEITKNQNPSDPPGPLSIKSGSGVLIDTELGSGIIKLNSVGTGVEIDRASGGSVKVTAGSGVNTASIIMEGASGGKVKLDAADLEFATPYGRMGYTFRGTTTQRLALAAAGKALEGTRFYDTTLSSEFERISGAWILSSQAWTIVMAAGPPGSVRAQYRVRGGYLEMRGMATKPVGTTMFTLPVGMRPFVTVNYHDISTPFIVPQEIRITAGGVVTHTNSAEAWVSFDTVRFAVAI